MERYKLKKDEQGDWVKWSDVEEMINELEERCEDAEMKLSCLEAGGVGDWEWYDDSLEEYYEWKNRV